MLLSQRGLQCTVFTLLFLVLFPKGHLLDDVLLCSLNWCFNILLIVIVGLLSKILRQDWARVHCIWLTLSGPLYYSCKRGHIYLGDWKFVRIEMVCLRNITFASGCLNSSWPHLLELNGGLPFFVIYCRLHHISERAAHVVLCLTNSKLRVLI